MTQALHAHMNNKKIKIKKKKTTASKQFSRPCLEKKKKKHRKGLVGWLKQ
jgi:hypothetical protein